MLTNKGKYGLKALVHLAGLPPGTRIGVAEVAACASSIKPVPAHRPRPAGFGAGSLGSGRLPGSPGPATGDGRVRLISTVNDGLAR
jgi:hypothetical protein